MKAIINKDKVELKEIDNNNSGSVNYYELECEFDSTWNSVTKEIIITDEIQGIHRAVINNKVYIDKSRSGLYSIGFVGYTIVDGTKTYQISTNLVSLAIKKGAGEVEVTEEVIPTPSQWEIYVQIIQEMIDDLEEQIPTKLSELTNDTGFITNTVNNLLNYYLKSETYSKTETYTKTEVNNLISQIQKLTIQIVDELPTVGDSNVIYFVRKTGATGDIYNEYIYINNTWELIGNTQIDLSNYYTKGETDTLLGNKVDKITGKSLSTNDYTNEDKAKLDGIDMSTKQDVMQYSTMPTASASNVDKIVQFVGTTDSDYTNGYFYKNVHTQIAESITATQTDNVVPLGTITLDNNTLKSRVSAGTHEFVYRPYNTVLIFMNLTAFPPVSYQVTRDSTFDRSPMMPNAPKLYSWVDNNNNFYATDTLQPNALTKLYTLDIQTNDLTDTGATFISSNTPSQIEGRWTKKESDVYTDVEISDYGILLSSAGLPGNTIQVNYTSANDSYNWTRIDTQPAGSGGSATWGSITGTLSNQTDLNTALGNKVNVEAGKGLSSNDYTTVEKNKLAGIDMSIKQNITDNTLQTTNKTVPLAINEVNSLAKQANKAEGHDNYSALITMLNSASADAYNVGQNFLIQTQDVPDLWVISIEQTSVPYTYTTDSAFVTATSQAGGQQVGYYKLGQLETLKQDLTNYLQNSRIDTVINSSSTNSQVASAKSVYDYIQSLNAEEVSY